MLNVDRSHTLIALHKNTQKSIENKNFELGRSIIPQFQSLPKSAFSTYNNSQKKSDGLGLVCCKNLHDTMVVNIAFTVKRVQKMAAHRKPFIFSFRKFFLNFGVVDGRRLSY